VIDTACVGCFGNGFNLLLTFLVDDGLLKLGEEFAFPLPLLLWLSEISILSRDDC